jgi:hypothetical protein
MSDQVVEQIVCDANGNVEVVEHITSGGADVISDKTGAGYGQEVGYEQGAGLNTYQQVTESLAVDEATGEVVIVTETTTF